MTRKPTAERAERPLTPTERSAIRTDCEQHREDLLDDALDDSFPASDPPSMARPPAKDC